MTLFKVSVNSLQYIQVHVVAWNLKTVDLLPKNENKSNSNIDTYMKKKSVILKRQLFNYPCRKSFCNLSIQSGF